MCDKCLWLSHLMFCTNIPQIEVDLCDSFYGAILAMLKYCAISESVITINCVLPFITYFIKARNNSNQSIGHKKFKEANSQKLFCYNLIIMLFLHIFY